MDGLLPLCDGLQAAQFVVETRKLVDEVHSPRLLIPPLDQVVNDGCKLP